MHNASSTRRGSVPTVERLDIEAWTISDYTSALKDLRAKRATLANALRALDAQARQTRDKSFWNAISAEIATANAELRETDMEITGFEKKLNDLKSLHKHTARTYQLEKKGLSDGLSGSPSLGLPNTVKAVQARSGVKEQRR